MGRRPYPCRVLPLEPLEKEALDTTWSTKYKDSIDNRYYIESLPNTEKGKPMKVD